MSDGMAQQRTLEEIGLQSFAPYLMNRIMGNYNESLRVDLAKLGMSTPKMRTLAVLCVMDGLLIRDLAVYAVIEKSTMSRTVDKLSHEGAVRHETDQDDLRASRIFITQKGRALFEQIWPAMSNNYERMFQKISDKERATFISVLQKILHTIRRHEI